MGCLSYAWWKVSSFPHSFSLVSGHSIRSKQCCSEFDDYILFSAVLGRVSCDDYTVDWRRCFENCSRIPGHWIEAPPAADAVWASYLVLPPSKMDPAGKAGPKKKKRKKKWPRKMYACTCQVTSKLKACSTVMEIAECWVCGSILEVLFAQVQSSEQLESSLGLGSMLDIGKDQKEPLRCKFNLVSVQ